ncbi:hypothetical protein NL108_018484 [Boleophthalmus pectinirostris]|nr:hypothetical protein NL108_018484 [Boleophthalmus pectinirostris]
MCVCVFDRTVLTALTAATASPDVTQCLWKFNCSDNDKTRGSTAPCPGSLGVVSSVLFLRTVVGRVFFPETRSSRRKKILVILRTRAPGAPPPPPPPGSTPPPGPTGTSAATGTREGACLRRWWAEP